MNIQFGYQKYGGTMKGWLVLPMNETYHKECPKCEHGEHANQTSMCTEEGPEPLGISSYHIFIYAKSQCYGII